MKSSDVCWQECASTWCLGRSTTRRATIERWSRSAAICRLTPRRPSSEAWPRRPTTCWRCAPSRPSTSTCCLTDTRWSSRDACPLTACRPMTPGCPRPPPSSRRPELTARRTCAWSARHRTAWAWRGPHLARTALTSSRESSFDGWAHNYSVNLCTTIFSLWWR